jgi:thiosulfate/3-mercaptopyruvate sulfurtransferase
MIRGVTLLGALCGLAVVGRTTAAQSDPRAPLLVSTEWLAQHLKDPNLVLLHVGDGETYLSKHLPGARFASMRKVSVSDPSKHQDLEMPSADSLRVMLQALGISDKSRIVVYSAEGWVSPATRVIYALNYAGLGAQTSLLDGDMESWAASGHETTNVIPPDRKGTLSALHVQPTVVDAEYVKAHIGKPGVSIVDARTGEFYDGVMGGGMHGGRKGHIVSAKSVPFNSVFDDKNVLLPAAQLASLFEKAGVQPGDTVVGYCHIGQQATAMLFAARSLGHPVLLYDGSFDDWGPRGDDYPVEVPKTP